MKTSLTRAREAASSCWLKHYCGEQDPTSMRFSEAELRGAFEAGMEERLDTAMRSGDDAAWTARVLFNFAQGKGPFTPQDAERAAAVVEFLWNDMGEARRLIDDAASLFRTYGKHHREQAEPLRNKSAPQALEYLDRIRKAERNEAMALRLERWLKGDPDNPAEVMRKIAESMVDGVNIKGMVHESFDAAAEQLRQPVDWDPTLCVGEQDLAPSDLTEDDISDRYEIERHFESNPGPTTALTGFECLGEDEQGRYVFFRPGADASEEENARARAESLSRVVRPILGQEISASRTRRPPIITDRVTVEDGGIERYCAGDDEFPVASPKTLSFDGVTSRERAEALRRRYNPQGHHPFYDSACRAEPVDHHGPEDCRAAMDAPAPGFDALRAFVTEDTRTWVEKAADWVRSLIDGPGYRRGGFVKDGLEKARPGIDEAIRNAAHELADRQLDKLRSNVRPVTTGPLSEADVVEGLLRTARNKDAPVVSVATEGALRLQTGDPRFDPAKPVMVNGYLYHPTTKGE